MIYNDADIYKSILIDCDVFRHLHHLKLLETVVNSLPSNFIMLDIVEAELTRSPRFIPIVKDYVDKSVIVIQKISIKDTDIITEHFNLISNDVGPGESACMSVARFNDNVIGSSNLSDIFEYCNQHKISYLTTLDLLCIATLRNKITEEQFNSAVSNLIANNFKLPNTNLKSYISNNQNLQQLCLMLDNAQE